MHFPTNLQGYAPVLDEIDHTGLPRGEQIQLIHATASKMSNNDEVAVGFANCDPDDIERTYHDVCKTVGRKFLPSGGWVSAANPGKIKSHSNFSSHCIDMTIKDKTKYRFDESAFEVTCVRSLEAEQHQLTLKNTAVNSGSSSSIPTILTFLAQDVPLRYQHFSNREYRVAGEIYESWWKNASPVHLVDLRPEAEREVVTPAVAAEMHATFLMVNALEHSVGNLRESVQALGYAQERTKLTDEVLALQTQLEEIRPHAYAHASTLESAFRRQSLNDGNPGPSNYRS